MDHTYLARAAITINSPTDKVWDALTRPELIKQYLFGTEGCISDWGQAGGTGIVPPAM